MGIKNVIAPDELSLNKYKLLVSGIIPIFFTEVKGAKDEVEIATLPDQTVVSGGRSKVGNLTVKMPAHHLIELRAMEEWKEQAKDPTDPNYKKPCTLLFLSKSNQLLKAWNIKGCFVNGEKPPDGDLKNAGDMAEVEFDLQYDEIKPMN